MNEFALARVLHVLGVVLWIGGVAWITTVFLPFIRQLNSASERVEFFERVEKRFSIQARCTTVLVGASGFYMVHVLHAWGRFTELSFWWMHAMVLVWIVFTLVLFVFEPLVLRRRLKARALRDPNKTFALIQRTHWLLLGLSLITLAGTVAGSHGWFWFGN
jgi:uncharacterized membrane protein